MQKQAAATNQEIKSAASRTEEPEMGNEETAALAGEEAGPRGRGWTLDGSETGAVVDVPRYHAATSRRRS